MHLIGVYALNVVSLWQIGQMDMTQGTLFYFTREYYSLRAVN
jgi:hypothetical protein